MFSKFALYTGIAASMAILATAAPSYELVTRDQCNGGSVHCCDSVASATPQIKEIIRAMTGVDVSDATGVIGMTCSPASSILGGGTSCSSQTVCCNNNNFSGLVVIGCTPININLNL